METKSITIIRSKRKTISLTVTRQGEVVVRAPLRAPLSRIEQFVLRQQAWIARHLEKARSLKAAEKQFVHGETFLYRGRQYPLVVIDEYRSRLSFDGAFRLSKHKQSAARRLFEEWYRTEASRVITERTREYAGRMGVSFRRVSIKDGSSRWGSCSSLGNLNFSYRLILAPPEILDYVVVHELAHLVHQNHSRIFWLLVAAHFRSWREARRWLREYGDGLRV